MSLFLLCSIRGGGRELSQLLTELSDHTKHSLTFVQLWIVLCILSRLIWPFLQCRWANVRVCPVTYPTERTCPAGVLQSQSPEQVLLKKEEQWPTERRDACQSDRVNLVSSAGGGGRSSGQVPWKSWGRCVKCARGQLLEGPLHRFLLWRWSWVSDRKTSHVFPLLYSRGFPSHSPHCALS